MSPLGIRLVGLNSESGDKLLLSVGLVLALMLLTTALRLLMRALPMGRERARVRFWGRQAVSLLVGPPGSSGSPRSGSTTRRA